MSDNYHIAMQSPVLTNLDRKHGEGRSRDQSFSNTSHDFRVHSVVRKSNGAIISRFVDTKLLHMATDSEKLVRKSNEKPHDTSRPVLVDVEKHTGIKRTALERIEAKLFELGCKLLKATRQGRETTAIDALILRCQYYRKCELDRQVDAVDRQEARDTIKLLETRKEYVPSEKPVVPASQGKRYKVKRKIISDKASKLGSVVRPVRYKGALTKSEKTIRKIGKAKESTVIQPLSHGERRAIEIQMALAKL